MIPSQSINQSLERLISLIISVFKKTIHKVPVQNHSSPHQFQHIQFLRHVLQYSVNLTSENSVYL